MRGPFRYSKRNSQLRDLLLHGVDSIDPETGCFISEMHPVYEWWSIHAVHLRGKLRRSRDYPWKSFCHRTNLAEDGSLTLIPQRMLPVGSVWKNLSGMNNEACRSTFLLWSPRGGRELSNLSIG
jgi:hypothetical protein